MRWTSPRTLSPSSCPSFVRSRGSVSHSRLLIRLAFTAHSSAAIRQATAESIAEGVALHPTVVAEALQQLVVEYKEKAKELLPQYDQYGMVIEESLNAEDPWRARKAIATTFKLVAPYFSPADVAAFFDILITGEALGDRSQSVRSEMLEVR